MAELLVDNYQPRDESEVLEVLRQALGEVPASPRTSDYWRWKHFENVFGPSQIDHLPSCVHSSRCSTTAGWPVLAIFRYFQWIRESNTRPEPRSLRIHSTSILRIS